MLCQVMFQDIFHSSLVKGKVSGPGIISEAFNPALCPFWKREPLAGTAW